jgi:hypothetical protein
MWASTIAKRTVEKPHASGGEKIVNELPNREAAPTVLTAAEPNR